MHGSRFAYSLVTQPRASSRVASKTGHLDLPDIAGQPGNIANHWLPTCWFRGLGLD